MENKNTWFIKKFTDNSLIRESSNGEFCTIQLVQNKITRSNGFLNTKSYNTFIRTSIDNKIILESLIKGLDTSSNLIVVTDKIIDTFNLRNANLIRISSNKPLFANQAPYTVKSTGEVIYTECIFAGSFKDITEDKRLTDEEYQLYLKSKEPKLETA